ncbi:MAG: methionyl-tRNA formyltransferase [Erysipelotrichaceae bacterium]
MKERIVFMGTPIFAAKALQQLIDDHYNVVAVVTQNDKKIGRKQEVIFSPVKQLALDNNIAVLQPENIKTDYQTILDYQPDIIITCAYGQFIPQVVLEYPKFKVVNIHASLLPKYRGGAPIHHVIINGEKETGITLMKSAAKMDAGDILVAKKIDIAIDDTTSSLHDKLIVLGCEMLHEYLPKILNNEIVSVSQNHELATFGYNISKEDEFIDFNQSYIKVYNHIRGLISWPVGYAFINGKKMKFHQVSLTNLTSDKASGTIIGFKDHQMLVSVDHHVLGFGQIQLEGKKKMSADEFYNGVGKSLVEERFNENSSNCN